MGEPLPRRLRLLCMAAAAACLLPLLTQVDPALAVVLAGVAALGMAVQRDWPWLLRLLVLALACGYILVSHGFSIGRDTGTAMLAVLLALKPYETRQLRDLHSLLGFSLFAPFTAFLQDQGPLVLALALPAVMGVLAALAALARQHGGARPASRSWASALKPVGTALLMALPLALAAFWLFPRLGSPLWGMPGNAMDRVGLGDRMTPDEWIQLFGDDSAALRVRFPAGEPDRGDLYWRGQVLWDFDGRSWSRGAVAAAGPTTAPERVAPPIPYQLTMEPTERRYLVTLDYPLQVPEGAAMRPDLTVVNPEPVTRLLSYSLQSDPRARLELQLVDARRAAALRLPEGLNPRMRALAAAWRADSGSDDVAVVRRALDWIARDFSYSLTVPPVGRHSVDEFLFDTRIGFCQHFSSAFANLMRAAGIPARVVLGYAGGYRNRYGDYWVVRRMDAHAWVEVWLPQRGWIRVDPTAAVAPERVLDTVDDLQQADAILPAAITSRFAPLLDLGDWVRRGWNEWVVGFDAARQARLFRPLGVEQASALQLGLAFAIGAGLALALTLWLLVRGRPPRDPLLRAWRRLVRRLRRAGIDKAASEPPSAFLARVAGLLPAQAAVLADLSRRYVGWRYGGDTLDDGERRRLAADLRAFRPAVPLPARGHHP